MPKAISVGVFVLCFFVASLVIGADASITEDIQKKIEPHMKWAEDIKKKADDAMEREDIKRFQEDFKKKLSNEITPEVEKYKQKFQAEGTEPTNQKNGEKKGNEKEKAGIRLGGDERVYIFMSSSVPEPVWERYIQRIDELHAGKSVILVMRGCIGGCEGIPPNKTTLSFLNKVLTDGGKRNNAYTAQIWIDPTLFTLYGIQEAPCFVYVKSTEFKTAEKENTLKTPYFTRSCGDWNFDYHISELFKRAGGTLWKTSR